MKPLIALGVIAVVVLLGASGCKKKDAPVDAGAAMPEVDYGFPVVADPDATARGMDAGTRIEVALCGGGTSAFDAGQMPVARCPGLPIEVGFPGATVIRTEVKDNELRWTAFDMFGVAAMAVPTKEKVQDFARRRLSEMAKGIPHPHPPAEQLRVPGFDLVVRQIAEIKGEDTTAKFEFRIYVEDGFALVVFTGEMTGKKKEFRGAPASLVFAAIKPVPKVGTWPLPAEAPAPAQPVEVDAGQIAAAPREPPQVFDEPIEEPSSAEVLPCEGLPGPLEDGGARAPWYVLAPDQPAAPPLDRYVSHDDKALCVNARVRLEPHIPAGLSKAVDEAVEQLREQWVLPDEEASSAKYHANERVLHKGRSLEIESSSPGAFVLAGGVKGHAVRWVLSQECVDFDVLETGINGPDEFSEDNRWPCPKRGVLVVTQKPGEEASSATLVTHEAADSTLDRPAR